MDDPKGEITRILDRLRRGEAQAADDLMALVYRDLRRIAAHHMRGERSSHTLQPTALVHETCIRLLGKDRLAWENRAHFFAAAARAMRNVLVDHARVVRAQKRGGGIAAVEFIDDTFAIENRVDEILALDESLNRLQQISPRQKTIVEMRFYGGFTEEEIAEILQVSQRTVKRDWAVAKAWLYVEMSQSTDRKPDDEALELQPKE